MQCHKFLAILFQDNDISWNEDYLMAMLSTVTLSSRLYSSIKEHELLRYVMTICNCSFMMWFCGHQTPWQDDQLGPAHEVPATPATKRKTRSVPQQLKQKVACTQDKCSDMSEANLI